MELGKRLKEVRLAQGLSQRQLCGDEITRNMLSQIENGSAKPSMDTLRYLANRLGKPVSFFLEEQTVTSPNQEVMTRAREARRAGDWRAVLEVLGEYRGRDPLFDEEKNLLKFCALLDGAEQAMGEGKIPYARDLLEQAQPVSSIYRGPELERRYLLLTVRATGRGSLPSLDEELLIRAELTTDPKRAAALLDGAEDRETPRWNLLRGRAYLGAEQYEDAARCLTAAEATYPRETIPQLERCYRELEDYKKAYEYACKQR